MSKRTFSNEEIKMVVRLHNRGNSKSAISKKLGCHHSVVTRVLNEARDAVAHTRFKLPANVLAGYKTKYDKGISAYDIAEEIGCSVPTAISKLRSVGTKIRGRGRPCKA